MNNDNLKIISVDNEIKFLKDLYKIMKRYGIYRIYTASIENGNMNIAQQVLNTNIGNSKIGKSFYSFLDKHCPELYYKIFFKINMMRYKFSMKLLFNKYKIIKIEAKSFNLFQGIYITPHNLTINDINLIYASGGISYIDNITLDI